MAAIALVPKQQTLYDLVSESDKIANLVQALDDSNELTPGRFDHLSRELIEKLAGTREKVDNTTKVLAAFEHAAEAAALEAARLTARKQYFERQKQRLEAYVIATLEASDLIELDGETSTLKLRLNPPSVAISEGAQLAGEFLRVPAPQPDKAAIKAALVAGEEVPGCTLERTKRLVRS